MSLTITAANQPTDWVDLTGATSPVCFNLDGDFVDPVTIQYSNDPALVKSANSIRNDPQTFATPTGPLQFPPCLSKFVRFTSGNVWTAGKTCVVRFSVATNAEGANFTPSKQPDTTQPVTA
jgi:hypothetical protein